ncbi:MAG: hypothetical protein V7K41_17570, partial [Nostoc sp.]
LPILGEGLGVRVKPGKFAKSSLYVKLTPMSIAVPLRQMWFKYMKTAVNTVLVNSGDSCNTLRLQDNCVYLPMNTTIPIEIASILLRFAALGD